MNTRRQLDQMLGEYLRWAIYWQRLEPTSKPFMDNLQVGICLGLILAMDLPGYPSHVDALGAEVRRA